MIAHKIKATNPTTDISQDIDRTILNMKSVTALSKTCLPTLDGNIFIRVSQICHFKSEDIYCRLYTVCGKAYFVTKPLKWVEHKLFKFGFYRIHKSYFINVLSISQYHKNEGGYLIMESGKSVSVSRSKRTQLQQLLERL